MPLLGGEVNRHVGLEKYKIVHHDFNHFTLGPGSKGKPATKMAFTLVDREEELHPSFNVLLVRTQKPTVLRMPLVRLFLDTWTETVELVRPVFRFGIPESSLRDKCKYWREDGSSIPTTPSLQTQRLMKAISNEGFGYSRLHADTGKGGDGHDMKAGGQAHGHGGKHHLTPFQVKEEFVEAVTPLVVFGLNVAAWCYLGSSANKPAPGI